MVCDHSFYACTGQVPQSADQLGQPHAHSPAGLASAPILNFGYLMGFLVFVDIFASNLHIWSNRALKISVKLTPFQFLSFEAQSGHYV